MCNNPPAPQDTTSTGRLRTKILLAAILAVPTGCEQPGWHLFNGCLLKIEPTLMNKTEAENVCTQQGAAVIELTDLNLYLKVTSLGKLSIHVQKQQ